MATIALLGTGLLGESIGHRLLSQGCDLRVWNRNPQRCQSLLEAGATPIAHLSQGAAAGCDAVITVLRDGQVTRSVVAELGPLGGSCVLPMGTMGITEIQALAADAQTERTLLGGTRAGQPTLGAAQFVGHGRRRTGAVRATTTFAGASVGTTVAGGARGQWCCHQAGPQSIDRQPHPRLLSLRLVQQAGVPVETFMAILRNSALYAPTFDKKLQRMLDGHYSDPNFSTALLRKDLRLFLEEATAAGLQVSGLGGLDDLLEQSSGGELDGLDYCSLHELTLQSPPNG